jgi:hypothetical protein
LIESEDDVRAYVRAASAGRARWVEPALGSTPGLPDCWVPLKVQGDGGSFLAVNVHLELKAGEVKGGKFCYTIRPEQKREIRSMLKDGVKVGILLGVKGTRQVVFFQATEESLSGSVLVTSKDTAFLLLSYKPWTGDGFWRGVNFIFHGN